MSNENNKRIIERDLDKLIGEKFGNYSKYIIQERALPDLRDGLKPVQRRVLFAMYDLKLSHTSAYKKSARVVGDVIGKYHPHGDTSVYEAMVRLGQEWKVNMPLVDMHGNKGSIDGDGPAAMRYTEARLAKITSQLLSNIEKKLVKFSPNFDDSELEPIVLPAKYPNLLVNGATGIASGYSTNIPPHNLKEVIKALIYIFKNESVTLSDLTKYIKGPDFPTGASISSPKSIKDAYKTGRGKITITSKWNYDEKKKLIEITEIPYETNKSEIVKKIDDLIRNNKIPSLKEVRDDTDRQGMQITLICKPDININLVMNFLFKSTDLRKNYSLNMVSIKDKKPQQLGLVDILTSFSEFEKEIYVNLYKFELSKVKKRMEIVDGLIRVVDIIDEIIRVIRKSRNKKEAKENIKTSFGFSEIQAEAIVILRLYRLTSTDINELTKEKGELSSLFTFYERGIKDERFLREQIIEELKKIRDEYGIERKSTIEGDIEEVKINERDLIQEEEIWLSITYQGYIKKVSQRSKDSSEESSFGKRDDDIIISLNKVSNLKNIVLFSSSGRYFVIPIFKFSESRWRDIGEHVSKFTSLDSLDRIISTSLVDSFDNETEIIFSTKNGMIKRSRIRDMNLLQTKRGSKFMNLKPNDKVVTAVLLNNDNSFITSITKNGYGIRYCADNLSTIGLSASGVKNANLTDGDEVVVTIVNEINKVDDGYSQIMIVTHNGKAKRMRVNDIRGVSRGSKGSLVAAQTKSNPFLIINGFNVEETKSIYILTDNDEILNLKTKGEVLISDVKSGLTKLTNKGILLSFNDLTLKIDELPNSNTSQKIFKTTEKEKTEEQAVQLNLDSIFDEF